VSDDDGGQLPSLDSLVRSALEQLRVDGDPYLDTAGPALYVVGPIPYTFTACRPCRYVGLIASIPKRSPLYWTHDACRRSYRLEPPPAVLAAGLAPPGAIAPRPSVVS
jgi:hypothetical protein